jgi:hypothetical protein
MELVYITHHSILNAHYIAPVISWGLVIGAVYGLCRGVHDVVKAWMKVDLTLTMTRGRGSAPK